VRLLASETVMNVARKSSARMRSRFRDTYRLAIIAKAVRPAHAETRQGFAIVVSLEGEDEGVNVFNLVRTRLGAGRVRIRVPGSS
jgi:hypothetical protein